ncbi:MAG TPA: hypothetical protein VFB74_03275 [Kribbellaceae bacterium]|nr:hypothetical protein [Kribbellaceae bacterium]
MASIATNIPSGTDYADDLPDVDDQLTAATWSSVCAVVMTICACSPSR